jgi:uncharacterized protein YxjI
MVSNFMYNREEKQLERLKGENEKIAPPEQIDDYIKAGIAQGNRKKNFSASIKITSLAASILFVLVISSFQLSPAFANYLKALPGIEKIIELMGTDKGVQEAYTNDYIQEIGITDRKGDKSFTVDHIIFDRSRMIIFYTFDLGALSELEQKRLILQPDVLNEQGDGISATISTHSLSDKGQIKKGRIEIANYEAETLPDEITLQVQLQQYNETSKKYELFGETYSISFVPNKEKFFAMEEEITLNETVTIDGFTFNVDRAVIYPTQIAVHFSGLDQNTLRLLRFEDLRLVDETGEAWKNISGVGSGEKTYTIFFESNFFKDRKTLSLRGSTIRALPKEDLIVALDIKKQTLLKGPDKLQFNGIKESWYGEQFSMLQFSIPVAENDEKEYYFSFDKNLLNKDGTEKRDKNGNSLFSKSQSFWNDNNAYLNGINISKKILEQEEIIYLKIQDFPNRLTKPFSIKIK